EAATFSMIGPSVRHGPHHGAQKSTTTGIVFDASSTSRSNVAVVTSIGTPLRLPVELNRSSTYMQAREAERASLAMRLAPSFKYSQYPRAIPCVDVRSRGDSVVLGVFARVTPNALGGILQRVELDLLGGS